MVLGDGLRFIWLDRHIGIMGEYQTFKQQFRANLQPAVAMPPNNINELIWYFEDNVAPIEFVSETDAALALIQYNTDKRIKLITSGSLGKPIIPHIIANYQHVDYFYIFCGYVLGLTEWALEHEYEHCMQILDHEKDLLLRLVRDASNDIITMGRSYMDLRQGEHARKCFVTAQTLETLANAADPNRRPFLQNLNLLNGDNGLIAQARNLN